MSPEMLAAIVQAGAVGILALVLWQVSAKIDTMMQNVQVLMIKLIDLVAAANNKTDRNYDAIKQSTSKPEKRE